MLLLEFDDEVEGFEEQPVKIPVPGGRGSAAYYVPDILVRRKPSPSGATFTLFEVKHTSDLEKDKNKPKYAQKFAAAGQFAVDRGWKFQVVTEKDIRSPYLANLKFLREYHNVQPDDDSIHQVTQALVDCGGSATYTELLDQMAPTDDVRLAVLPVLWHMVAVRKIMIDLSLPIGVETRLSLPKGNTP